MAICEEAKKHFKSENNLVFTEHIPENEICDVVIVAALFITLTTGVP